MGGVCTSCGADAEQSENEMCENCSGGDLEEEMGGSADEGEEESYEDDMM